MRLDASVLRYLTRDDFRVLTAIEMGMKNHELVPTSLICTIAGLAQGPGAAFKIINTLHRNKLIYHENQQYDGYRLTYLGYDYLALRTYVARGLISALGRRIGVGKEADIYECANEAGEMMVLKIHRLGRISFRQIKNKRDYLLHRKNASWMYMSRLAAIREYTYMKALYNHGFPVPVPYDQSRHTILMSFIAEAYPFGQVREISNTGKIYNELLNLIVKLAEHGLIHADFNEFNLMISKDGETLTMIDFPQMVSTRHPDAEMFFQRDVACITRYFTKRFGYLAGEFPRFNEDVDESKRIDLDKELEASGYNNKLLGTKEERKEFEKLVGGKRDEEQNGEEDDDDEEEEDDEEEAGEDDEEEVDEVDEETLATSLGITSSAPAASLDSITSAAASSSSSANEQELTEMKQQLEEEEQEIERKKAVAPVTKKSSSKQTEEKKSKKSSKKQEEVVDEQQENEEDEEEYDSAAEEASRLERMARKDARQRAHAQSQALKAARKAAEKERKRIVREGGVLPETANVAAIPQPVAASSSSAADASNDADDGDDNDDDHDDTASIASCAASFALSQLSRSSTKGLLNIQLPKQQVRLKKTNRNKNRELVKVQKMVKEHM